MNIQNDKILLAKEVGPLFENMEKDERVLRVWRKANKQQNRFESRYYISEIHRKKNTISLKNISLEPNFLVDEELHFFSLRDGVIFKSRVVFKSREWLEVEMPQKVMKLHKEKLSIQNEEFREYQRFSSVSHVVLKFDALESCKKLGFMESQLLNLSRNGALIYVENLPKYVVENNFIILQNEKLNLKMRAKVKRVVGSESGYGFTVGVKFYSFIGSRELFPA